MNILKKHLRDYLELRRGLAANALGHDGKGAVKSFGALGAYPPQCRQLD
jgi:hypothetical protein